MSTLDQWIPLLVFGAIAAVVMFGAALAGAGRFGGMPDPVADQFVPAPLDRALTPDDLRRARFAVTLRGYSPEQVDKLLAQAAADWARERRPAEPAASVWAPERH